MDDEASAIDALAVATNLPRASIAEAIKALKIITRTEQFGIALTELHRKLMLRPRCTGTLTSVTQQLKTGEIHRYRIYHPAKQQCPFCGKEQNGKTVYVPSDSVSAIQEAIANQEQYILIENLLVDIAKARREFRQSSITMQAAALETLLHQAAELEAKANCDATSNNTFKTNGNGQYCANGIQPVSINRIGDLT